MEHEHNGSGDPPAPATHVACPGCGARIDIATGEATWAEGTVPPASVVDVAELERLRDENAALLAQLDANNRQAHGTEQVRRAVNRYLKS